MHTSSLSKFHGVSQIIHGIEHHKLATLFGISSLVCLLYVFNIAVDHQGFVHPSSADPASSFGVVMPLTLLEAPQFGHEYDLRVHSITQHLKRLRTETRADRAYVVVYGYDSSPFGEKLEKSIFNTFEVVKTGDSPQFLDFQGFSRLNWLRLKKEEQEIISGLVSVFPRSYGMELANEDDEPIGYIGIEYWQDDPLTQSNDMHFLRQTAIAIEARLLQPLDHLRGE
jgi:hypothetical protein